MPPRPFAGSLGCPFKLPRKPGLDDDDDDDDDEIESFSNDNTQKKKRQPYIGMRVLWILDA